MLPQRGLLFLPLRDVDDGLRSTVAPDADNGHGEAESRQGGPGKVAPGQTLDAGADLFAIDVVEVLLAGGFAVSVAEDFVAGLHTGARGGRRAGRRGGGGGGRGGPRRGGLGHQNGGDGGEGGEEGRVEEVGVAGVSGREDEAKEEGGRGERGEGQDGRLEGRREGGEAVRGRGGGREAEEGGEREVGDGVGDALLRRDAC